MYVLTMWGQPMRPLVSTLKRSSLGAAWAIAPVWLLQSNLAFPPLLLIASGRM